jgi:predicted alpha-1,6-mannanase (GH76 family)
MKMTILIAKYLTILITMLSCTDEDLGPLNRFPDGEEEITYDWDAAADSIQETTYNTFLSSEGTFRQNNTGDDRFHYWWNAHMVDALVDGYIRTNDESYLPKIKALVRGIRVKNGNTYVNVFNDDMQWLAIACLRAYQITEDEEYMEVARFLWNEIKKGWSDVHGGGITWRSDRPLGKNACSNGPAAIIAALFYQIEGNQEDLDWAINIYNWLKNTLVDPNNGLVWDNIEMVEGEPVINKDWVFTYNQGTYIGSAAILYELTGEIAYLNDAMLTATTCMSSPQVTSEGLMRNENQGDGGLFR